MGSDIVLGQAIRSNLIAIQRAEAQVARLSTRLASGRDVQTALDSPDNFFTALGLSRTAQDLNQLLDGIGQSVKVVETALHGIETLTDLIEQGESIAATSLEYLQSGEDDPSVFSETTTATVQDPLSAKILPLAPDAYWQLDETSGTTADNQGAGGSALDGTLVGGVTTGADPLYGGGSDSFDFDGSSGYIAIPDSALINTGSNYASRTVELVFSADTISGRQVLYEEGATVNGFAIYIDDGVLRVTGEDDGDWANANLNATIDPGQAYHVAFVFDQPTNRFEAYLDGTSIGSVTVNDAFFPSHSGDIGIGAAADGVQFHDGESSSGGYYFNGRISDVALYNAPLTAAQIQDHALSVTNPQTTTSTVYRNSNFEELLAQINQVALGTHYRGINLLAGDTLTTIFNPGRSNSLVTEGQVFTYEELNIKRVNFNNVDDVTTIIESLKDALETVRSFGESISNDLNIIQLREDFTRNLINTNIQGADRLTVADENQTSANFLAAQTRLQLAQTSLALASQSGSGAVFIASSILNTRA